MDFSRLQDMNLDFNATGGLPPSLPSTVMEMLVPGYGTISQLIYRLFGLDIGILVSGFLVIWGFYTSGCYMHTLCREYFDQHFTSSIQIDAEDSLYMHVMSWIGQQRMTETSRSLVAVSRGSNSSTDNAEPDDEQVLDSKGMFNYERWANNTSPRYEPSCGTDNEFQHEKRHFTFSRTSGKDEVSGSVKQTVTLRCYGRSTKPIKYLLDFIKRWSLSKESKMTGVYRAPGDKYGRYWSRQALRPSRPLDTVSLDGAQKAKIVTDINEYLHPATARWYAARGIPHRRGYLFHGPPGTGKTSLSFALAGIFGLDIYCVSLNDKSLTEGNLGELFDTLPTRCVVLLEDIDSAGLVRREEEWKTKDEEEGGTTTDTTTTQPGAAVVVEEKEKNKKKKSSKFHHLLGIKKSKTGTKSSSSPSSSSTSKIDDDSSTADTTSSTPSTTTTTSTEPPSTPSTSAEPTGGISLSALLNTIDGAASHEGHVLIMTTNTPEKLDSALIRPGRVDLQVHFTLATRAQVQGIFLRMFGGDAASAMSTCTPTKLGVHVSTPDVGVGKKKSMAEKNDEAFLCALFPGSSDDGDDDGKGVEVVGLDSLAERFANEVPEKVFSPAEIQGFLLMHKKEPRKAVEEVGKWREEVLEARKKGKKVVGG